jgi:hypothetical protein
MLQWSTGRKFSGVPCLLYWLPLWLEIVGVNRLLQNLELMAVVRWQTTERNWLNRVFRSGSKVALEAKAALYLISIQVLPPCFVHQRDLSQLQQWISEGIMIPQPTQSSIRWVCSLPCSSDFASV